MLNQRSFRSPRQGEIAAFLSRHATSFKEYGDEIQFRPCPKCGKDNPQNPCVRINKKTGFWRCFRCDATGGWYSLTKSFGSPIQESDRYLEPVYQAANPKLIEKFTAQKRRPVTGGHYPELIEYCENRGISRDCLDKWRISTKGQNNLRWPIYEWLNNRWVMVNAKCKVCIGTTMGSKDWFEYAGGPTDLLIGNHLINYHGPKRVIITEGQFDAMTGTMMGLENVFSLPNGGQHVDIAGMLRYIPQDWELWLCVDMDDVGDRAAEQFFARASSDVVKRCRLPHKDLNAWYQDDPYITEKELTDTLQNTKPFFLNNKEFIEIDMSVDDDIERQIIAKLPWQELNKLLGGGILGGQTTGILAPSGGGKTSFCNHAAIHFASNGVKVGHIALESTRAEVLRQVKEVIRSYSQDFDKTINNYMLSNLGGPSITVDDCVSEIDKMIGMGSRIIIFDNIDFIAGGDNDLKAKTYKDLIRKVIESDIHLFMVWQPNKVDKKALVNSGNQKGYSMMFQDSDNYISLNRVGDFVICEIEKNRLIGTTNKSVKFQYNHDTRLFDVVSKVTPMRPPRLLQL